MMLIHMDLWQRRRDSFEKGLDGLASSYCMDVGVAFPWFLLGTGLLV